MATNYAAAVSEGAAADPNALDTIVTVDTGATATAVGSSGDGGGGNVTEANKGFAGAQAILDDTSYDDDGDNTIGSGAQFAPGHGTNNTYANEKLSGMSMGGITPGGTAAQGILTIAEPVTDEDEMTIGDITYRFMDTPAQAYDIEIGANEAATKVNIPLAINANGATPTNYYAGTHANPKVSAAAAFSSDELTLTAVDGGLASDSIATTETFTHDDNVFDATTLGAETEGKDFAWVTSLEPVGISADVALKDQN